MRTACGNKKLSAVFLHSLIMFAVTTFCHSEPITTALLVEPRTTANYFQVEDLDGRCSELISNWESFLDPNLFKIEIASDTALPNNLGDFDLVILPGTLCLSDNSLSNINDYLSGGGGLLLTWGTGFRDEEGTWRGASFIEKHLGISPKKSLRKIDQGFSLRLRDGQPGTMSIDPGYKIKLTSSHTPLYLPKNDFSISAGYWTDEEFNPGILPEDESQTAFVIRQFESGSRIAWFGCPLDQLEIDDSNDKQIKLVFQELLEWLSGGSISSINPWPKGFNASMLIQANYFAEFDKIKPTQDIFDHIGVAATFNILTKTSKENVDAINSINTKRFEIGLLGDKNAPFAGFDVGEQVIRLKNYIDFFDDLNIKPSGLYPALNTYDVNTIEALYKLGIKYLIANDRSNQVVPFNFKEKSTGSEILLFPKNELDDLDIKYKLQVNDRDKIIEIMSSEAEKIWDLNGLYRFCFHSDITPLNDLEYIVKKIVKKAELNKHIWIATANDIATWKKQTSELTVTSKFRDKQLDLHISNNGDTSVKGSVLRVLPPRIIPAERMAASKLSRSTTFDVIDGVFYMNIPELKPGEVFTATLEKRSGVPLSAATKKFFSNLFKISIYLFFAFLGALSWWFIRKKRKSVNILDPEGNLREENNSTHYSIYDKKEDLASVTTKVNTVNVPKSNERPARKVNIKPTPVRIKRVIPNESEDTKALQKKNRIETEQPARSSATHVAPAPVAPVPDAPVLVAPIPVAPVPVVPVPVVPVPVTPVLVVPVPVNPDTIETVPSETPPEESTVDHDKRLNEEISHSASSDDLQGTPASLDNADDLYDLIMSGFINNDDSNTSPKEEDKQKLQKETPPARQQKQEKPVKQIQPDIEPQTVQSEEVPEKIAQAERPRKVTAPPPPGLKGKRGEASQIIQIGRVSAPQTIEQKGLMEKTQEENTSPPEPPTKEFALKNTEQNTQTVESSESAHSIKEIQPKNGEKDAQTEAGTVDQPITKAGISEIISEQEPSKKEGELENTKSLTQAGKIKTTATPTMEEVTVKTKTVVHTGKISGLKSTVPVKIPPKAIQAIQNKDVVLPKHPPLDGRKENRIQALGSERIITPKPPLLRKRNENRLQSIGSERITAPRPPQMRKGNENRIHSIGSERITAPPPPQMKRENKNRLQSLGSERITAPPPPQMKKGIKSSLQSLGSERITAPKPPKAHKSNISSDLDLELTKKLNQAYNKKPHKQNSAQSTTLRSMAPPPPGLKKTVGKSGNPRTQEMSAKTRPMKTRPQPRDGGLLRSTASIPDKTRTAQKQVNPQQGNQAKSLIEKNLKPPSGLKSTATIPDKPKNMENKSVATDWK